MIIICDKELPPECIGRTFIIRAVARDQENPCKGCALSYMGFRCQYECGNKRPPSFSKKINIKKVKDGDVVMDGDGNKYRVSQTSDFNMVLERCFSK